MVNLPYITHETNTAAYLVLKGYKLLGIQYKPRTNGTKRGFFIFEASDTIEEAAHVFEEDEATFNYAEWERIKSDLLDRIRAGQQ